MIILDEDTFDLMEASYVDVLECLCRVYEGTVINSFEVPNRQKCFIIERNNKNFLVRSCCEQQALERLDYALELCKKAPKDANSNDIPYILNRLNRGINLNDVQYYFMNNRVTIFSRYDYGAESWKKLMTNMNIKADIVIFLPENIDLKGINKGNYKLYCKQPKKGK